MNIITNKNQEADTISNDIILKYHLKNNDSLKMLDEIIDWDEMAGFVAGKTVECQLEVFDNLTLTILIKCILLGKIHNIQVHQIREEIRKENLFKEFLKIENEKDIPSIKLISSFSLKLTETGLFDNIIEKINTQILINEQETEETPEVNVEEEIVPITTSNDSISENKINESIYDKLHVKMFDVFFDKLDLAANDEILSDTDLKNHELMKKIKYVDEIIRKLKNENLFEGRDKENGNSTVIYNHGLKNQEPTEFRPGFKTEGIFNDENLTEDYELGYRFHQLGLKMGFFNVKLDNNNESSRISTAEFFPNKFWPCVKQRSRWIAGICLQNWKAHKWKGNLTMKYFLFRDRKPLFSLFSAFLSNIILLYLVYAVFTNLLYGGNAVFLVSNSSVLYYIMAANVVFMLSRACHRFIFTYNWYGFRYAFFSFARQFLDTAINFFAVLRSLSVYRKTKKKVIWDSTSHY